MTLSLRVSVVIEYSSALFEGRVTFERGKRLGATKIANFKNILPIWKGRIGEPSR